MAKRALPYVKWFPRDILDDSRVETMTIAQEGAYRRILDFMWTLSEDKPVFRGLPDDDAYLRRITKMQPSTWRKTREVLFGGEEPVLYVGEVEGYGQRVLNARLQAEHRNAVDYVEGQSSNARGNGTTTPNVQVDGPLAKSGSSDQGPSPPKSAKKRKAKRAIAEPSPSEPSANQNQITYPSTAIAVDGPPPDGPLQLVPDDPVEPKLTDAQAITNRCIELGMRGVRPAHYGKWANHAKTLLTQQPVDYWLRACEGMALLFPYSEGEVWSVFDLGKKGDKAYAAVSNPARAGPRKPIVRSAAGAAFVAELEQLNEQSGESGDETRGETLGGEITGSLPEHTE